jgi:hypothetical protein
MRQLGKGHSVMFFAPGEVDRSIRNHIPGGVASDGRIRVLDVLRWAMHETCDDIRHHLPYWAQQGLDHHKRFTAYNEHRSTRDLNVLRDAWLQPESRTLEEMYWVTPGAAMSPEIYGIPSLKERIERLGVTRLVDVRIGEEQEQEQEREAHHEVEHERQIERPPKVQPAPHVIHEDILEFVSTGNLHVSSGHISRLLAPLDIGNVLDSAAEWSPSPLATEDFTTTVLCLNRNGLTDYLYLRPVNWILSSGSGKKSTVVVISPYEANELLPIIREKNKVRLHVYAPRVASSMRSFSNLTFYTTPDSGSKQWSASAHIRTELDLFAGQLYFDSKTDYERACVLLALTMAHPGAKYCKIDGFVPPAYRTGRRSPLKNSMVARLKTLIGLRRKGMDFSRTHLGQILSANPLSEETLQNLYVKSLVLHGSHGDD